MEHLFMEQNRVMMPEADMTRIWGFFFPQVYKHCCWLFNLSCVPKRQAVKPFSRATRFPPACLGNMGSLRGRRHQGSCCLNQKFETGVFHCVFKIMGAAFLGTSIQHCQAGSQGTKFPCSMARRGNFLSEKRLGGLPFWYAR